MHATARDHGRVDVAVTCVGVTRTRAQFLIEQTLLRESLAGHIERNAANLLPVAGADNAVGAERQFLRVRWQNDGGLHGLLCSLKAQQREACLGDLHGKDIIELPVGIAVHAGTLRPLNHALTDRVGCLLKDDAVTGRQEENVCVLVVVANHLNQLGAGALASDQALGLRVHRDQLVAGLHKGEVRGGYLAPAVIHRVRAHGIHERDAWHAVLKIDLHHCRHETVSEVPIRSLIHLLLDAREVQVAVDDAGALLRELACAIGHHLGAGAVEGG